MGTKQTKQVFMTRQIKGKKESQWTQVGIAFVNNDGSLNVILDAYPRDGRLHIRDPRPTEKGEK